MNYSLSESIRLPGLGVTAFILAFAMIGRSAQAAYSMPDCFRLTVARSDILAQDLESIRQAEESIRQTRANFLPTINFAANWIHQEQPQGALGQNLFPSDQKTAQFSGTQSLFKGFQDIAALRKKKSLKDASSSAWQQAYLQLYQDTAQAYFAVLEDEHDLSNYGRELAADQSRFEQLASMKKYGRAREADVVSIEASIQNVQASIASARGILGADRETLSYLTGLEPDIEIVDVDSAPATSRPLADWLSRLDARPDVRGAFQNWQGTGQSVAAAKGQRLPNLSLSSDYYPTRPGAYSDVHWDAQLSLSLPLFSGGQIESQIRQAVSVRTGAQAAYDQARRQATEAIRSVYQTVVAEVEQSARLAEATRLYDHYYKLLLKDNQSGIATNVDVLLALAIAEQTRRSSDRARLAANCDFFRLRIASADVDILAQAEGELHGATNRK